MKSRHLSIAAVLLAAVMLVLSLSACTTGEYVPTGTTTGATQEPTGPVTQLGYQFTMPDEDAEVVVEFFKNGSTD